MYTRWIMLGPALTLIALVTSCSQGGSPTTSGNNSFGAGNGQVSFWTDTGVGGINVTVDGTSAGTTTLYFPSGIPRCGQNGTLSVVLSEGTHTFAASSGIGATWNGNLIVTEGQCQTFKLAYTGNTTPNVPTTANGRPVDVLGTIYVKRSDVVFKVWDHGTIDGDIISLAVNGQWYLQNYTLTGTKRSFGVSLYPRGYSYVLLYAHNEGSISPNTAALSIDDGTGEQTHELRANLSTNGAYNLIVQP